MAICNQINHVLCTRAWFFFKSLNLNFTLRVLHYSKLFLIVKKITDLSTVNFEKTHCKCGTAWSYLKQFIASVLVNTIDSECFSRTSLSVSKTSDNTLFKKCWQKVLDLIFINTVRRFTLRISVIKFEARIINVFRDSVYFDFRFMYNDFRIAHRCRINFTVSCFLCEKRTFSNANANSHFCATDMV